MNRRTLIKATLLSSTALTLGVGGYAWQCVDSGEPFDNDDYVYQFLTPSDRFILVALVITLLSNYLDNQSKIEKQRVVKQVVQDIDEAISRVSRKSQEELRQLLALLGNGIGRLVLLKTFKKWSELNEDALMHFLGGWRYSMFSDFVIAYQALHRLIYGAFYTRSTAWSFIGYQR